MSIDIDISNKLRESVLQKEIETIGWLRRRMFFFVKNQIYSFPRYIYIKFSEEVENEYKIVKYFNPYDIKLNALSCFYSPEQLAIYTYQGDLVNVGIEPKSLTPAMLKQMIMRVLDPHVSKQKALKEWLKNSTFRGKLKSHPDLNVIIWEEVSDDISTLYFNENLLHKNQRR